MNGSNEKMSSFKIVLFNLELSTRNDYQKHPFGRENVRFSKFKHT